MGLRVRVCGSVLGTVATLVVGGTAYADPAGTVTLTAAGTRSYGIALSPGRVYYSDFRDGWPDRFAVRTRTAITTAGRIQVGAEQTIAYSRLAALSASSGGRLVFDGDKHRDPAGRITTVPTQAASPMEMSGNRWSYIWSYWDDDYRIVRSLRGMYDVRTAEATNAWPQSAQDLFGNYLLSARADGSVRLRNLLTGKETVPRGAGSAISEVALHGRWAAWVTGCPTSAPCSQTLTVRDLSTGSTRTLKTRGTRSLDLSSNYLGYDTILTTTRALRTLHASTGTIAVIGNLPPYRQLDGANSGVDVPQRDFDLDDETVGWFDVHRTAKLAHLPSTLDPPRYLGNLIAPASFSSSWTVALPSSKALPVCTVTILRGGTTVRTLGCANIDGMAAATWDGRTSTGAAAPAGTYTYRVSGRDDDSYWLRDYDGVLRSITGTVTKIA